MTKRLLIIIPNLGRGGAQQVFRQQLKYLSVEFEVFGCVFNWDGAFPDDHADNIYSLDVKAGESFIGKAWMFLLRVIRLRRIKFNRKIDVSISHLEGADYVNLLSRVGDCKTICWIHGTKKYDKNISGFVGLLRSKVLMPLLYRQADRIVTVSKGIAIELSEHIKGLQQSLSTIYNGFDLDEITILSNEHVGTEYELLFHHPNIIITHCRLSRQKNLTALFSVFSELRKVHQARLLILGDGELRDQLISYARELSLKIWSCWEDKQLRDSFEVFFLGHQSNPFKLLSKGNLYVMTSAWEGFPLALCEAMACGLPVISSDCFTGPREIIAPELIESQPIKASYPTHRGILMPIVDASDNEVVQMWVKELIKLLSGDYNNVFNKEESIDRIKHFQLSESINQTINLVKEI